MAHWGEHKLCCKLIKPDLALTKNRVNEMFEWNLPREPLISWTRLA